MSNVDCEFLTPSVLEKNSNLEDDLDIHNVDKGGLNVSYSPEVEDPSLTMRLRDLEFETSRECVSMGRGYLNMGNGTDRYGTSRRSFVRESENWSDKVLNIYNCSVCGSLTHKNMGHGVEIFCSEECVIQRVMRGHKSDSILTSVFDLFYPGETGTAEMGNDVVDGRGPCTVLLQGQQSVHERLNIPSESPPQLVLNAQTGDVVLVDDEKKGFLRGVVTDTNGSAGYKVALIDYGESVDVESVYSTSEYLKSIMSFGGVMSLKGNESSRSKLIKFRVKERRPFGAWLCDVLESDCNDVSEITLEEWVPPMATDPIPLESGCTVVITQYLDAKTMYVRRVDGPWNEEYIRFSNDIAVHCLEANKYKRIPNRGEICCARYEKDGSYYRGVVHGEKENMVVVSFVDFGSEQLTKVADLSYLPALGKQASFFCELIRLKDVSLRSSPGAINYLNRLTAYKCELVLSWEGNTMCEVVLMDKNSGETVNDVIYDYEIPSWLKSRHAFSKSGEVYTFPSVQEVSLKCGGVEDVFVLNFDENNFRKHGIFWCTVNRRDYLGHLKGELKKKMTEFCGYLENDVYLPRKGELCIAEYKGEWNRAVCLGDKDVICKLTLIDLGVSTWIETKNIRKILKEFLEMPALALKCSVSGLQQMTDEGKEDLIGYLKKMNGKVIPKVEIIEQLEGVYNLSITIPPDCRLARPRLLDISLRDNKLLEECSAVTIICPEDSITFDDIIAIVKSRIDFRALEMEEPIFRKINAGLLVLQITGETSVEDSRLMVEELNNMLSQKGVKIGCITKGKIKVTGIPERVTKEEVIDKIINICSWDRSEIQVTTFTQSNRYRMAWVKCPVVVAIEVAEKGKLPFGSTLARVELQQRRPLRCFRCLREGHIGAHCVAEGEELKCFRCSQMGHIAATCEREPHCEVCSDKGFPATHRIGSSSCKSRDNRGDLLLKIAKQVNDDIRIIWNACEKYTESDIN